MEEHTATGENRERPVRHHRDVSRALAWVRGRLRHRALAEGVSLLVILAASLAVILCALDNLLHLGHGSRLALLTAAAVATAGAAAFWLAVRPLRSLDDEECARLLERCLPSLESRLANTIAFDRIYDRERRRGLEALFMELVEDEARRGLETALRPRLLDRRRPLRLALGASAALVTVALYGLLFPGHFQNALRRLAQPLARVPPLTDTVLHVRPGDTVLSPGEPLTVVAEIEGRLPEEAVLHLSHGSSPRMRFDGRSFRCRVEPPAGDTASFTYWVEAGDAESETFTVRRRRPPRVASLAVTVESPPCTRLPARVEEGSSGNLQALAGSRIVIDLVTTLPAAGGHLLRRGGEPLALERVGPCHLRASLDLAADLEYAFSLTGEDGAALPQVDLWRRLEARDDGPPACEAEPQGEVAWDPEAPGGIPLLLRLSDDVGLGEARILAALSGTYPPAFPGGDGETPRGWVELGRLESFRGEREAVASWSLDPAAALAQLGGAEEDVLLMWRAAVTDLCGHLTLAPAGRVRRSGGTPRAAVRQQAAERLAQGLGEALRRERALHRETRAAFPRRDTASFPGAATALAEEQEAIRALCLHLLAESGPLGAAREGRAARRAAGRAAREVMPLVAAALTASAGAAPGGRLDFLERALAGERRAIALLERALGLVEGFLAPGEGPAQDGAAGGAPRLRAASEELAALAQDLEKFAREQAAVIARTRDLLGASPEDFTAAGEEALEELAAAEERWGRYLEEKGTDLSKVAPQDLSVSTLVEEVVELVEEVDLSRDALRGRDIELAVPLEQSGLELAEALEANIERWLLRDRDRLKWVMEEPLGQPDVPLADLPAELEDIVGELVDREELMSEETEDITSSWLDSLDAGAGWDIMDGPIGNMSARGATGNLQPNDMEIGGRAGEGRAGKSQGQFVEETAAGKGGRQTPSRSTPDPFEAGEVRDRGRDPSGGATGGGKLAGAGAAGLRGAPSPELERRMGALAGRQAAIRQIGEKASVALRRRRFYPENLERALELMKAMEKGLRQGRPWNYETLRRRIAADLEAAEEAVAAARDHAFEAGERLRPLAAGLLNARGEEIPHEFRDLIERYFRALAPTGGGEREEP